jgi:hypothetical protein
MTSHVEHSIDSTRQRGDCGAILHLLVDIMTIDPWV